MMKAIIFDFDGVIHDTFELAYKINKKIRPNMSPEKYKDFFNGNIYKHKEVTKESSGLFFKYQNKEFKKLIIKQDIKDELLKLKDKYKLFIVSSNMEEALNEYLRKNNILLVFTKVLGMESHLSKVEKFKRLFKEHSLTKDNCVFVTDTLGDILEATKVGLKTIAVDYGFHSREQLEKGKPIKIISHLGDLFKD